MSIMEEKPKVWVRTEKYDALTGHFIRDMRNNDIITSNGRSASSTLLFTTTNGANTNLYPYIIHVQSMTGIAVVALMAGTTTLGIYATGTNEEYLTITSTPDAPLGKVAASTSMSVEVIATETSNATVAVTVISNRVPINSKI